MTDKRPIDRKRESGGHADIGTAEDGAILELVNVKNRLIIIKEKAIYEAMMADDIDPMRTNINLPNHIHKLIANQGVDSELVSRTFLLAKMLFKSDYFDNSIDSENVQLLSLDILQELVVLEKEISGYLSQEHILIKEYEEQRNKQDSYAIPSMLNIETSCKTIFQKTDHIEQILMEIITVFYPKDGLTKQSHFLKFYDVIEKKYEKDDPFSIYIKDILNFMGILRNLRNSLDHRLKTVEIKNFELQPDGRVLSPTIELKHRESELKRIALSELLPTVFQNMMYVIESIFVFLADKNVKTGTTFYRVKEIPENKRRYKYVEYCFWSPLGNGYFHQ